MFAARPDLFTAIGLTAVSAFVTAWMLWALGRKHWREGTGLAVLAALLDGTAYMCWTLDWLLGMPALKVAAAALLSAGLSAFTLALDSYPSWRHRWHRITIAVLPVCLAIGAGLWQAQNMVRFEQLYLGLALLQTIYLLGATTGVYRHTPGRGWKWMSIATSLLLVTLLVLLDIHHETLIPWSQYSNAMGLLLALLCSIPLVVRSMLATGFLLMLDDRETATTLFKTQQDALTQLPNRAALIGYLRQQIAWTAQHSQPLALMVLDIDHFKSVNDTYGHLVGDQVIQSVARTLSLQARASDFAARYGGEEFVMVLPGTNARDAFHVAERLCQAVRKAPLTLADGQALHVSISIGVYVDMPSPSSQWERWMGAADEAMYTAKRNGRDRVYMSAPVQAMQAQSVRSV